MRILTKYEKTLSNIGTELSKFIAASCVIVIFIIKTNTVMESYLFGLSSGIYLFTVIFGIFREYSELGKD